MTASTAFLAAIHPLDTLPPEELSRLSRMLVTRDLPGGATVHDIGDRLSGAHLIESGTIGICDSDGDILSRLGPGSWLGARDLLRDGLATARARTETPGRLHLLPGEVLRQLIDSHPAVGRFFEPEPLSSEQGADFATLRLGDLTNGHPVSCTADTPVIDAARIMRDARISSIGVIEADRLVGILTVRDMCNRVVAAGYDPAGPVSGVMTPDPITLPSTALGLDVLSIMLARGISHLPVVDDGRFVGMVSQTDVTRVQAMSSAALMNAILGADAVERLAAAAGRIPQLLVHLVGANHRHEVITRMITDVADAITRRLIHLAELALGPAPAEWLWAACGSQGRQEQTGLSDQDNCIILADGTDPHHPWFRDLARFVSDGLNTCGYVYCPGDMMATNDRWRQPQSVWRGYFRHWIERPSPEAQLLASVMFDLRPIHGNRGLIEGLRAETLRLASRNSIFVAHMTMNSLGHRPPLGFISGLATIKSGAHRNMIDMKLNGVVPVTELARVYALKGDIPAVNTRARLVEARARGIVSDKGGRDLIEAYDLIQSMRLVHQARRIKAGRPPDNYLAPSELPDFQRGHLRDAFLIVRAMQSAAGQGKGMLR